MAPAWLTDSTFIEILRCPRTKQSLRWMIEAELAAASQRTQRPWQAGLSTTDGLIFYPVEDGVFGLLEGLALERNATPVALTGVKEEVQRFYDEIGWQREGADQPFGDAELYEDLRPVAREYIRACHQRVNSHLTRPGRYLLDVASGPIQYSEYLDYNEGFSYRICVDLSRAALTAAREKLGDGRGLFVLGDITNLPLRSDTIDAVVSLHTIYHVPVEEQEKAFIEIQRVLQPGHTAVVVYTWADAPLTRLLELPGWPIKQAARLLRRWRGVAGALYYHPHSYDWFTKRPWAASARVLSWRSVGVLSMRAYVHAWLGGAALLRGVALVEERYPELMGRIGQYPLIVMTKPA